MNQKQIYDMIENKIIDMLENEIIPWRKCYHVTGGNCSKSHLTKKPYSLLNQFLLSRPGEYWTFEQATKEGYKVRKGAKSEKVVFWKILSVEDKMSVEDDVSFCNVPFLKYHNVFHESDIEGLPEKEIETISEEEKQRRSMRNAESIPEADNIVNTYLQNNPTLLLKQADMTPCFSPSEFAIYMPQKHQFDSIVDYYDTLFHEMTHSTKIALNRNTTRRREELVAEIGAAYLCGNAGISEEEVIKNNAAYCANWMRYFKNNIKDLVWASARAERSTNHILGVNQEETQTA